MFLLIGLVVLSACTSQTNSHTETASWKPSNDAKMRKLVFSLPDMDKKMCETFPKVIIENLESTKGVIDASFDYEGHIVTVIYDQNTVLREDLLEHESYSWIGTVFISEDKVIGENALALYENRLQNNNFDMPPHHMEEEVTLTKKGYADVGATAFKELIGSDEVFVLDVHTPEQAHIPGTDAVIPYNELEKYQEQLPKEKDAPIALYCRSGSMSKEAAQALVKMGYTNITNLIGGANEWKANGFPVEE